MKNKVLLKIGTELARIILGGTFVFSGYVKSVDPYGTAYKIDDYLDAFHLSRLAFLDMTISFVLCGFELMLGIMLLLGIFSKWTTRLMLITMCFMTPLTLYLAIANPVSSCGCFGDALVITNWETFYKNVVLLALAIFLIFYYHSITPLFKPKKQVIALGWTVLYGVLFLFYNLYADPLLDFRPYKQGGNLPALMTVDPDKQPVTELTFIYEKDGKQQRFPEDNYPWQDSTWTFVKVDSKIIKEGELPPITDFAIDEIVFNTADSDIEDQYDITEDIFQDEKYTFLVIAPFLSEINETVHKKLQTLTAYTKHYGYHLILLTASDKQEILNAHQLYGDGMQFAYTDEKVLKTIVRNNPGLLVLKKGTIVAKWNQMTFPEFSTAAQSISQIVAQHSTSIGNATKVFFSLLVLVVPLALLRWIGK
ncbi:BT_3928 family protein [Neptunitalea lumnitzerae]|uniref:Methylamine utilisation protein MauE domain-containing protein n=1 Tax=Neptunitalea lumnitzerae TaxID=2965509 RepID=A0ABQ5MJ87_9FLAO|nr:BT_3928 family protein [Neptunitalea sp. Y10]GLB49443.1 hypothetical protein Y10_18110 [Neptunitalea sp. Y10]